MRRGWGKSRMNKKPANNAVVLRRGVGIGSGNAESDDEFLFSCFVTHPAVEQCMRTSSAAMVLAGRTGAGKTAILRHIKDEAEHAVVIDPFEMSMSYVSNSDTLRFLDAIGGDLDLLFQVLWKHVLCIEFIRLRWGIETEAKSQSIFSRLSDRFSRDDRRKKAINYLRNWQGKFWITMDENIKEIAETVERQLRGEFGAEVEKFKAGGQYDRRMSREKKSEIVARTRDIISADQLAELHRVIDLLSVEDGDGMKSFYIMIDRLDEKWVDERVRFRLIKALVETLKSFRKITNLKILVALREDVIERVVQETNDISFQREKFEDAMIRLNWTKGYLRQLVDRRLNALFKRQYTGAPIGFQDVFPASVGGKDTFEWMLDRTLLRPRDMIAFVNEGMNAADGHSAISLNALRRSEAEFARKRRDALVQEWMSAYPTLNAMLVFATSKRKAGFEALDLADRLEDFCLEIASGHSMERDPIVNICNAFVEGKAKQFDVLQQVLSVLYRVAAIGLKLSAEQRFVYSYSDQPLVAPELIPVDAKVRIHPMLHAAYNLNER